MPPSLKPPACASAAPINPPINVCEELDGIPNHHVSKFHAMAATSPAQMTCRLMKCSSTDFEIVFPILNSPIIYFETKKAAKLKSAAQSTAWKGVSTLVETMVAIEFAASWKPLMKSKISASTMITTRKAISLFFDIPLKYPYQKRLMWESRLS